MIKYCYKISLATVHNLIKSNLLHNTEMNTTAQKVLRKNDFVKSYFLRSLNHGTYKILKLYHVCDNFCPENHFLNIII